MHCILASPIYTDRPNENLRKLQICRAFPFMWPPLYLLLSESKQLFFNRSFTLSISFIFMDSCVDFRQNIMGSCVNFKQNLFKIHTWSMKKKDINSNSNEFSSTMNRTTIQKNYKSDHVTVSFLLLFLPESKHNLFKIYVFILIPKKVLHFWTSINDFFLSCEAL